MSDVISKELLSAVLGIKLTDYVIEQRGNFIYYETEEEFIGDSIYAENILELAHRGKEWAYKLGYEILVGAETARVYQNKFEVYSMTNMCQRENFKPFDTHYTLRACQWILDKETK